MSPIHDQTARLKVTRSGLEMNTAGSIETFRRRERMEQKAFNKSRGRMRRDTKRTAGTRAAGLDAIRAVHSVPEKLGKSTPHPHALRHQPFALSHRKDSKRDRITAILNKYNGDSLVRMMEWSTASVSLVARSYFGS